MGRAQFYYTELPLPVKIFLWRFPLLSLWPSLVKMVKNPPAVQETQVIPGSGRYPGGGNATHSSVLAWRIPVDRGTWRATVHEVTESVTTEWLTLSVFTLLSLTCGFLWKMLTKLGRGCFFDLTYECSLCCVLPANKGSKMTEKYEI